MLADCTARHCCLPMTEWLVNCISFDWGTASCETEAPVDEEHDDDRDRMKPHPQIYGLKVSRLQAEFPSWDDAEAIVDVLAMCDGELDRARTMIREMHKTDPNHCEGAGEGEGREGGEVPAANARSGADDTRQKRTEAPRHPAASSASATTQNQARTPYPAHPPSAPSASASASVRPQRNAPTLSARERLALAATDDPSAPIEPPTCAAQAQKADAALDAALDKYMG